MVTKEQFKDWLLSIGIDVCVDEVDGELGFVKCNEKIVPFVFGDSEQVQKEWHGFVPATEKDLEEDYRTLEEDGAR